MSNQVIDHPKFLKLGDLVEGDSLPDNAAGLLAEIVNEIVATESATSEENVELSQRLSMLAFNMGQLFRNTNAIDKANTLTWLEEVRFGDEDKASKSQRSQRSAKGRAIFKERNERLDKILQQALVLGFLVANQVDGKISFAHLLWQDYFAAFYLNSLNLEGATLKKLFGGGRYSFTVGYRWKLWSQMNPRLIETLATTVTNGPNWSVRRAAGTALNYIGDYKANDFLLAAFNSNESWVRENIIDGLIKTDPRAIDTMIVALKDPDSEVRWTAAFELSYSWHDAKVAEALIQVAEHELDEEVRSIATNSLGQIRDQRATPVLIKLLKEGNNNLRPMVATALRKIQDRRAILPLIQALQDPLANVRSSAVDALHDNYDRRVVAPFIELLQREEDADIKRNIVWGLGSIGDPRGLEPVLKLANDQNEEGEVRSQAISVLGFFKDDRLLEIVLSLLAEAKETGQQEIIEGCISALGKLNDSVAIEPLLDLLQAGNIEHNFFRYTIQVLGELKAEQAIKRLLEIALNPEISTWPRTTALDSLGEIGPSSEITNNLNLLKITIARENEPDLFIALLKLMARFGDTEAIEELLAIVTNHQHTQRSEAVEALSSADFTNQNRERIVDVLSAVLEEATRRNDQVKRGIIETLGNLGDRRVVELLIGVVQNDAGSNWWRNEALEALGKLGDLRALPAIEQALQDQYIRSIASEALLAFGAPALEILLKALTNPDSQVRWQATISLGKLGDPQAGPALWQATKDPDEDIRYRALEALAKLGLVEEL